MYSSTCLWYILLPVREHAEFPRPEIRLSKEEVTFIPSLLADNFQSQIQNLVQNLVSSLLPSLVSSMTKLIDIEKHHETDHINGEASEFACI